MIGYLNTQEITGDLTKEMIYTLLVSNRKFEIDNYMLLSPNLDNCWLSKEFYFKSADLFLLKENLDKAGFIDYREAYYRYPIRYWRKVQKV